MYNVSDPRGVEGCKGVYNWTILNNLPRLDNSTQNDDDVDEDEDDDYEIADRFDDNANDEDYVNMITS